MNPIHYFWVGETFSNLEILTFQSCRKNNHTPCVWTYNEIKNAPDFVRMEDASTILDRNTFNHYIHELKLPLANISDIFRYHLLHKIGGYYSDTDVVVIKNFDTIDDEEFFCSTHEYEWGECANGCFMKVKAGSAVSHFLLDECGKRLTEMEQAATGKIEYCHLGPFVVQECTRQMPIKVLSYDHINPIHWRWVHELIAFKKLNRKFYYKSKLRRYLPKI
ncbi:MAG TPA: glycosyltransferase, partial [Flavisolibacter sp.]